MSAAWRAARAAVQRRKLQTFVLTLVVAVSAATLVVALALLDASTAPFDKAFAAQRGAHLVATFDPAKVADAQLTAAAQGAEAVGGPYHQATVNFTGVHTEAGDEMIVVGRDDPAGPVDKVNVWRGHWATQPGEIVMNMQPVRSGDPVPWELGSTVTTSGGVRLTVVGYAYSISQSAHAWVSTSEIGALKPSATEMLYRFGQAANTADLKAGTAAVTGTLPAKSLLSATSYLTLKRVFMSGPTGTLVPFLGVFGGLAVLVAVLIVANVVSGAVVSGFRHIGILKALGFTPGQVMAVYQLMVFAPALAGCTLGVAAGYLGAKGLLLSTLENEGVGSGEVAGWVLITVFLGLPLLVLLTALIPTLRARSLSAADAISAGSAPRPGRATRIQRWLSGTRLPRPVSLGLGMPLARPGRAGLTVAALVLGVLTVVYSTGTVTSLTRLNDATDHSKTAQVTVRSMPTRLQPGATPPDPGQGNETVDADQLAAQLNRLPGTGHLTETVEVPITLGTNTLGVDFLSGDYNTIGYQEELVRGRWLHGPGEAVAGSRAMHKAGLAVGDELTLRLGAKTTAVKIVGEVIEGVPGQGTLIADRATLDRLATDYRPRAEQVSFPIQLTAGTTAAQYEQQLTDAQLGLALGGEKRDQLFLAIVISLATLLSLLLATVAALGVFNTAVLNTRERRRDLGMLKSIGMTPGQVLTMVVTSMVALGLVGGLLGVPLGMLAHGLILPRMGRAALVDLPGFMLHVWQPVVLVLLILAGVAIAVLGALAPASAAARLRIAEVLHNE